jgi:hypothetical protein
VHRETSQSSQIPVSAPGFIPGMVATFVIPGDAIVQLTLPVVNIVADATTAWAVLHINGADQVARTPVTIPGDA